MQRLERSEGSIGVPPATHPALAEGEIKPPSLEEYSVAVPGGVQRSQAAGRHGKGIAQAAGQPTTHLSW